ncbi:MULTISPECIES: ribosome silencing factor [Rhodobacterales]|uniref:ribosome silencing factor n=1 Tax=Roseobacter sp. N2S TaxID=2663844 RepID=UPI0028562BBF|nr:MULTISPECIES: ribosome silencing factor [Rhodobacterales]MDR6263410.1 ribosome-associated protein [Roseobacter sp. N2S]
MGVVYSEDIVLTERVEAQAAEKEENIPAMSMLDLILNSLQSDKAEDIVTIDLAGKSSVADHMVVASGRSTRQVVAMAEKMTDRLKQTMGVITRTEGKSSGDWVLLDAGDVIVHLFRPEVRDFYQLEKMWQGMADDAS